MVQPLPPIISAELDWNVELEDILAERNTHERGEVLVKWKNLLDFEATWEPIDVVKEQFHEFPLEDKVNVEGGGIDGSAHVVNRPPINASRPQSSFTTLGRSMASRGLDRIDGLSKTVTRCEGFNTFIVSCFYGCFVVCFFLAELAS